MYSILPVQQQLLHQSPFTGLQDYINAHVLIRYRCIILLGLVQ